jgi:succinylglutamate desuccinylase
MARVALFGGTHGNEYNGVFVCDTCRKNPSLVERNFKEVHLITGNPRAVENVIRFVDEDLNRQFSTSKLMMEDHMSSSFEATRAKYLNSLFGPKPHEEDADEPSGSVAFGILCSLKTLLFNFLFRKLDFAIDLHTTTSNMGCW